MSNLKRFNYVIQALLLLLGVVLIISMEDFGFILILFFLLISLLVAGVNQLIYYFTLARYMTGGKLILLKGLILLALGIQGFFLDDFPEIYVMLYLVMGLLFGGMVDVLRAFDTKKREGTHWRLKLVQGCATILISLAGLFFVRSTNVVVYFYCFGLICAAITKLTEAFRAKPIVYIS